jgi:hypothetical protein
MMTEDEWVHCDQPHHFIGSRDCRWSRATRVGCWIVSSIGDYWPQHAGARLPPERRPLGHLDDRPAFYETMVFPADRVGDGCAVGGPLGWGNVTDEHYATEVEAEAGHEAMCRRWAARQLSDAAMATWLAMRPDWEGSVDGLVDAAIALTTEPA